MSRKRFIESHGAECKNWYWSWSFINHAKKFVIFGEWQNDPHTDIGIILNSEWEFKNGKKQCGYGQAMEHIGFIRNKKYELKTFPMIMKLPHDRNTTAKINKFDYELTTKSLEVKSINGFTCYFATPLPAE